MSKKRKPRMSAIDALDLVPDDMPDGAALAMAAEMADMDYGDFINELSESAEAQASDERKERRQ